MGDNNIWNMEGRACSKGVRDVGGTVNVVLRKEAVNQRDNNEGLARRLEVESLIACVTLASCG